MSDQEDFLDDENNSYGYDDENDASYEEEVSNVKRKGKTLRQNKKKKQKKNLFIEEDAEESNGEEEEEVNQEKRLRNQGDSNLYRQRKARDMSEVIHDIEQRGDQSPPQQDDFEFDDEDFENMPANMRKYGIQQRKDQNIFSVPVRKTKEKEVVICLLNKYAQLNPEQNYGIYSISYVPSVESLIYIEGINKRAVINFLDKYPDCNCNKIELVNIEEFQSIFEDQGKEQESYNAEVGQFVRISRKARNSDYINDIGQIFSIKKNNRVVVKLIPRVKIEDMRKKYEQMSKNSKRKNQDSFVQVEGDAEEDQANKKGKFPYNKFGNQPMVPTRTVDEILKSRPQQQFFSYEEYGRDWEECYKAVSEEFRPEIEQTNLFQHCGYVYKTFNCKDLIFNEQLKSLEELKQFYPHLELDEIMNENGKYLKMANNQTTFVVGDPVLIDNTLKGKIISLGKETAKVLIKKKKLSIEEEYPLKQLVKYFEDGSRVKVISGTSEGITGTVLSTKGDVCEVFTDNNNTIEVRTKDLAITGEASQDAEKILVNESSDKNLGLKKKDLVKLTGFNNIGLILDISKDYIKILDQNGKIKNVSSFSINTKIDTRKYIGKNAEGNNITNNSNIIIKQGQYSGYQCQVIHVYKSLVFLFNPKFRDTYTVENINNVSLQTTNPVVQRQEAKIAYDMKYGKSDNLKPDDMKQYVGRSMRIIGGKYKGFQCTVTDIRNDQIKVEINSKFITVFIPKCDLIASDKGQTELEYGKTPSYNAQSIYQPNNHESMGSPTYNSYN
ncbi:hypothetical protein ABPG74_001794 [Tetrahymena malaccensis]